MSTDAEFIERIARAGGAAGVVCRKMFGEYGVYCDGKVYALACDNVFYVKPTPAARALLPEAPLGLPYPGGRPMLIVENVDDEALMCALAERVAAELSAPKKRRS